MPLPNLSSAPDVGTPAGERLAFALDLAHEAGALTQTYFSRRNFDVSSKPDGSLVTIADREAETLLRNRIRTAFPSDGLHGEEFGRDEGDSGFTWLLDPIDGTTSFVHGVPLYGNLIAIEFEGRQVAGLINMPALGEMVYASEGRGAWHRRPGLEPVPAHVSDVDRMERAMLVTTSYHYFQRANMTEKLDALQDAFGDSRGWSDCYAHLLVATGRADAVVEPKIHPWDIAPMIVIMREAGGRSTDWEGRETAYAPNSISSNGAIHDDLLRMLS